MSSGSSGWVIAIRESIVGVSDATDSGGPGISVDLDGSSADGVGGFGGANLGGGVGGVNYMSVTLERGNTCFGRKLELISPMPTKKSYGMTLTRFGCHPHTSPLSSITATVD